MAPNFSLLFVSILLLLPIFSNATPLESNGGKPKPFGFLEHLKGCQKGEKVKGLRRLKQYLMKFGYLNSHQVSHDNEDDFDDHLESAIKTYQLNYNLKPSGILDSETVKMMMMPRCGVPDITNGTTSMRAGKKKYHHSHSSGLHIVSHYAFFPGPLVWPPSKTHLTYVILPNQWPRGRVLSPVCARAFQRWADVTHFTFEEIQDRKIADISIGVLKGDHGDGLPFDGPEGILAHAFAPEDGRFHYDADEKWVTNPMPDTYDLETVAKHEIGHLLGLAHSSVEDAIMYPIIYSGVRKDLYGDDVVGIRTLYNITA